MKIIVFLVAGMSSRFGGKPKQFAKIGPNNETLIEYSMNQALTCSFDKIIFITNEKTEYLFRNIFGDIYNNIPIMYVQQKYDQNKRIRPWGTCDAICSINNNINDDDQILMVNGDDIYGIDTFREGYNLLNKKNIIGGLKMENTMPDNGNVNRGIIKIKDNKVVYIKELYNINKNDNKDLMNELANVNFIGLQKQTINLLNDKLLEFKTIHKDDNKIECCLTDILGNLIETKKIDMYYFEIKDKIIGITNPNDEQIVKDIISKKHNNM